VTALTHIVEPGDAANARRRGPSRRQRRARSGPRELRRLHFCDVILSSRSGGNAPHQDRHPAGQQQVQSSSSVCCAVRRRASSPDPQTRCPPLPRQLRPVPFLHGNPLSNQLDGSMLVGFVRKKIPYEAPFSLGIESCDPNIPTGWHTCDLCPALWGRQDTLRYSCFRNRG
jgi:hypothetical protein